MNFFIIHGVYANPDSNWFPWLKKELEARDYDVLIPKFPTPFDQSLESWLRVISHYENNINENTFLIGHSLGAVFILNYLEKTNKKVKAAFLVAGFHKLLGLNPYDELNKTFADKKFNWEKIRDSCDKFFVFASDNDKYISLDITKELARNLDAELVIIKNGGHLNKESGYDNFTILLNKITNFLE